MLTKEECLKTLEDSRFLEVVIRGEKGNFEQYSDFKDTVTFVLLEQLINEHFELVEKATPMKVEVIDLDFGYFDCPKCGNTFCFYGEGFECNYCPDCGQTLYWEAEEPSNES